MADKTHEVLDLTELRKTFPQPKVTEVEKAEARLRGKGFSKLTPAEKNDLLMLIGVRMGLIAPEEPEH